MASNAQNFTNAQAGDRASFIPPAQALSGPAAMGGSQQMLSASSDYGLAGSQQAGAQAGDRASGSSQQAAGRMPASLSLYMGGVGSNGRSMTSTPQSQSTKTYGMPQQPPSMGSGRMPSSSFVQSQMPRPQQYQQMRQNYGMGPQPQQQQRQGYDPRMSNPQSTGGRNPYMPQGDQSYLQGGAYGRQRNNPQVQMPRSGPGQSFQQYQPRGQQQGQQYSPSVQAGINYDKGQLSLQDYPTMPGGSQTNADVNGRVGLKNPAYDPNAWASKWQSTNASPPKTIQADDPNSFNATRGQIA